MSTASTPKGYPYPNGDDPIANGDNMIKSLADKLEATAPFAMCVSAINTSALAANTGVSVAVTFPVGRFTFAPYVACGHTSSGYTFGTAASITAAGCSLRAYNPSATATTGTGTIMAVAVQMLPTGSAG